MSKLIQITCYLFIINSVSQSKNIKGQVLFKNTPLFQVHIYNINTSKGTVSDKNGEFNLSVNKEDRLVFSSIAFEEKYVIINNEILASKFLKVFLLENITELEEVEVKQHNLVGNLLLDSKKVPIDANNNYKITINVGVYDLSKIPETGSGADRGREGNNIPNTKANPLAIAGLLINVLIPEKKIRKKPNTFTKHTPDWIRKELGDTFFITELHIPKYRIDDFLEEYCNSDEFIALYEENNIIECIEYLIIQNKIGKYRNLDIKKG